MNDLKVLIPISFFACIVLCTYFVSKYRSETITKLGGPIPKLPRSANSWKRLGIVINGLAIGLLLSGLLFAFNILKETDWTGFIITGIIALSIGIALIYADKYGNEDQNNIDG